MIQGHGNDKYNYGDKIEIDFSSNIAFNNHSEQIIEHLKGSLSSIENYPDPSALALRAKIAAHHNLHSDEIMVCNGSAEAFYMVAHLISLNAMQPARTLIFTPSFAEYEDSCKLYAHNIEHRELELFNSIDYSPYNSVWIGTPNNPDGKRVVISDIESYAKRYPQTQFIVDRAYNDLSASCDEVSQQALLPNVTLIHSMTKSFGIPGLRLGYVIAQKRVIESLTELRPPWSVNAVSLAAGDFIMDNYQRLSVDIEELLGESQYLQQEIAKIEYLRVTPSDANFFLCEIVDGRTSEELHSYLVEQHGILIRNASNFRGLSNSFFRIAAQSRKENLKLIQALKQWR